VKCISQKDKYKFFMMLVFLVQLICYTVKIILFFDSYKLFSIYFAIGVKIIKNASAPERQTIRLSIANRNPKNVKSNDMKNMQESNAIKSFVSNFIILVF